MSPAWVVVLVSLAAYRLARLVTEDALLDGPRDWVLGRWPAERHKAAMLAVCPYCVGVWAAVGLLAVAHAVGLAGWPLRYDLIVVWAVAGIAALASAVDGRLTS